MLPASNTKKEGTIDCPRYLSKRAKKKEEHTE